MSDRNELYRFWRLRSDWIAAGRPAIHPYRQQVLGAPLDADTIAEVVDTYIVEDDAP